MKREDDEKLWDLLGRAAEPKISPFFARNVLREIRQPTRLVFLREWFSLRRLLPAASVAVAVAVFVILRTPTSLRSFSESRSENVASIDAQDYDMLADLDDLAAADDNNSDLDSAWL